METPAIFSKFYDELKKINLIYTHSYGIIPFYMIDELKRKKEKYNFKNLANNINKHFYEGFGFGMISEVE